MLMRAIWLVILAFILGSVNFNSYQAQGTEENTAQRVRIVGIISGRDLNSAAPSNIGDDGISRLSEMFRSLGASVYTIRPNEEIPREIELVVIIRPQRAFSAAQTAYLWDFLQNGGHMLLALDPNGHNRVNSEASRNSGINRLLQAEYGLSIADDLLIEDWFGLNNLNDVVSSWSEAQAEDLMPHPITAPLIQYDLPIRFWGARSVFVDSVTGVANTQALVYTNQAYGETSRLNFQDNETNQLLLNIGTDMQGRLLLGGVSTNLATGSRVALIGDGEIFQNLYGQTRITSQASLPLFPGNYIFTQRLLSWLLAIPEANWQGLPQGFTWISLDGDPSDWSNTIPVLTDNESNLPFYSLRQVRAFRNDQFVYVLLETVNPLPEGASAIVFIDDENGNRQLITADTTGIVYLQNELVPDGAVAFGQAVEIRLPRRIFSTNESIIAQICIRISDGGELDCYEESIQTILVNTLEPVPLRFGAVPQAFTLNSANLRRDPNAESEVIVNFPVRTPLAVFGRNEEGDWLFVRNGRYEGWINSQLLELNSEVANISNLVDMNVSIEPNPEVTEAP